MKLNHKDYYTSGRINTQNKHDFTYGRFEARCKVPNEFEFTMKENSYTNGRVEFNMGAQGSKATVHITNVRVEKMGQTEDSSGVESYVLPDGNYIYNSTFERGENRLGYSSNN